MTRCAWLGLTLMTVCGGIAGAAIVDDFDGYANQAAFEALYPPLDPMRPMVWENGAVHGIDARNVRNLDSYSAYVGSDANPLKFEFWTMLDDPTATGAANFCELRGYAGDGYGAGALTNIVSVGVYGAGSTQWNARTFGGGSGWINLSIGRSPGWHKLTALIKSSSVEYYVDDFLAGMDSFTGSAFDTIVLGSDLTSSTDAWFDNLRVEVVPEPAALALAGLGGFILRRRRP